MNIDLSLLSGKLLELAKFADEQSGNRNGVYLDSEKEVSLFLSNAKEAIKSGEITEDDVNKIFGFEKRVTVEESETISDEEAAKIYTEQLTQEEKEDVTYETRTNSETELSEMSHELDSMLIENEITGLGLLLNKLPNYDLNELADKYKSMQNKFNEVEGKVENWYKNPQNEDLPIDEKQIFEEAVEQVLGMPYEDYAEMYSSELEEVAKIPPIIRGVSSIAEIIAHEEAVSRLSDTGLQVYRNISTLNSVLAQNFSNWENDIIYKSIDKSSDMSMDVSDGIFTVEMNEYASDTEEFEMPENWLVKKHFVNAIDSRKQNPSSVGSVTAEAEIKNRKIIKDGQILIEKVNSDGTKEYYDTSGKRVE